MAKRTALGFALLLVLCVGQGNIQNDGASMDVSVSVEVHKRLTRNALDLPALPVSASLSRRPLLACSVHEAAFDG